MRKPKTRVAFVLDSSGSMQSYKDQVIKTYNFLADEVLKNDDQDVTLSLLTFANIAKIDYLNADKRNFRPLTESTYRPNGCTALWDGFGLAVRSLQSLGDEPDVSYLVIVVTDGEENASQRETPASVIRTLFETQKTDRWSYAFQLPPGRAKDFARTFGIPSDNIREWAQTAQGVVEVQESTAAGLATYFQARSAGKMSVPKFFVTTDLSAVKASEVKKKLDDISDRFKLYTVANEASVKEFVEEKTKRSYVIGSAYYQLMKTEKVQKTKRVLIMEKGKQAVWGGDEARELIGLPVGQEAKVEPGNHAGYDIYIQSTSTNRKLPRGTKVLIDVKKAAHDNPTWGSLEEAVK